MLHKPFVRIYREAAWVYNNIHEARWLILGVLAGMVSGVAAILFFLGIEYFKHLFLNQFAGVVLPAPVGEALFHGGIPGAHKPWLIPCMTTGVGLVTGFLVNKFIPDTLESGTDGTDATIKAFHQKGGKISPAIPLIKGTTSILTIATGGSAGREGPITQIGAGLGSWLAEKLNLSARERRILLLSGAAGGLGAIFRAPMGGALTAIEVIYREDFESEAVLPSVLSSVVAYSMITLAFGHEPILGTPEFQFTNPLELPFYVLLALACAVSGWFYIRTFYFIKYSIFNRMRMKVGIMWTMTAGGLAMGLMGMQFPELLTGGYGWLELAVHGNLAIVTMLLIIFGKTIATSCVLGSGMSGGMFAPALFVGGMTGGVVGFLANDFFPDIVTQPGGYVLVGMAAFFAGVANAPIGPLFMVCELTQGYGLLAPLMLASAVTLVLNRNISLYENQVHNKFDSPAHAEDATINVLENLKVENVYKPGTVVTLEESTTLKALADIIKGTRDFYFPVRGPDGHISGILSIGDVRQWIFDDHMLDLIVVKEVARKPATLSPQDDLYSALMVFIDTGLGQVPVIDEDENVIGSISRETVFKAYSDYLENLREETDDA